MTSGRGVIQCSPTERNLFLLMYHAENIVFNPQDVWNAFLGWVLNRLDGDDKQS